MMNRSQLDENLPDNYVCNRCRVKGHHIKNCPENGKNVFNPYQARGIPKSQQYLTFGIQSQLFE